MSLYCEFCGSGPTCCVCGRTDEPVRREGRMIRPGLYIRHVLNCTVLTHWETCDHKERLIVRGRFTTPHAIFTAATRTGGRVVVAFAKV